ncbi:DUF1543 domain-containing protein [Ferruginibacter sp.]
MEQQLFFLILGCKPAGRNTEQHDAFFGVGTSLKDLIPQMEAFWPDAGKIHIDSWRAITNVDGHTIKVVSRETALPAVANKLFFLNLGGYKPNDLEEYHYKLLTVSKDKGEAVAQAKKTAFYLHNGFAGATSHIDDKYGVDVDDIYEITDILPASIKEKFTLLIEKTTVPAEDELHIGYVKLSSL